MTLRLGLVYLESLSDPTTKSPPVWPPGSGEGGFGREVHTDVSRSTTEGRLQWSTSQSSDVDDSTSINIFYHRRSVIYL